MSKTAPTTGREGGRALAFLLASTMLCLSGAAYAQDTPPPSGDGQTNDASTNQRSDSAVPDGGEDEIIVTAQKRAENLQDVPMAVTALGTEKLDELQVTDFDDYAKFVPSISYQSAGPGFANVYFRGVASGENANHSTSLPSVGTYLDEQPITTITGALDIHVFDIARVEALAGPQGTLYGASSQAGTVRIITNKPDTSGFYGEANVELNKVSHGGWGYIGEAFLNAPISSSAAIRVVGWYKKDAGYIDNIPGSFTFPTSGIVFDNDPFVEDNYNDVETWGGRAALQIDLDDNWTVTPQIMGQKQTSHGIFAEESGLDELQVQQFNPEVFTDKWIQASLTIQGKIGNFDITYAGAYLRRQIDGESDYIDYGYFYDALFGYGSYWYDNDGVLIAPNQLIVSDDSFSKQSHELRIASPADKLLRFIGGLFFQRQTHNIEQHYIIPGIIDDFEIIGHPDNIWLTKQLRVDRDYAIFGEVSFDFTDQLTATLGGRLYRYKNSLVGFFGYQNPGYSSNPIYACQGPPIVDDSPCTNLDKVTSDNGFVPRVNLTYRINDDALVYATYSRGFRPGGINRRGTLPPYQADIIDNYEFGFKTEWADRKLRINGAVYWLDWTDIQLSFLGANGLTEVRNAGNARVRGAELDVLIRPTRGLSISLGGAYNDAEITEDFCLIANEDFDCTTPANNALLAPAGTRLPITSKFKGNALARYEFPIGEWQGHVQGALTHEGRRTSDLRLFERELVGDIESYTTVDLTAGVEIGNLSAELFVKNLFDVNGQVGRFVNCLETTCGDPEGVTAIGGKFYTFVIQPRTVGLRVGTKF
jgi:outer membrane receptor protein involved in Fe transport